MPDLMNLPIEDIKRFSTYCCRRLAMKRFAWLLKKFAHG